jgi:putative restriction endonuclease
MLGPAMNKDEIRESFSNIKVGRSEGVKAPHKPLLILFALGKCSHGEERLISYHEVKWELGQLLKTFGGSQKIPRAHYPFWRLHNDNIWVLTDTENVRETSSGDASEKDLITHNVSGGFQEEIYQYLQARPLFLQEISSMTLHNYFPENKWDSILDAVRLPH